jgi:general secretion pathway protein M
VTGMTGLPSGVPGRVLAVSVLCAVIGLGYAAIVAPLVDVYRNGKAALANRELLVPKLEHLVAEIPALRARLAALQTAGTLNNVTLDGATDALASANLQSRLEQLAASNGVAIATTEAIAAEDRGPYRRIGLRLAVNGKYEAIVKLLAAIEETAPPLVLDGLQIHGLLRAVEARSGYPLETRFEVYGLRADGTKTSSPQ